MRVQLLLISVEPHAVAGLATLVGAHEEHVWLKASL